MFCNQCGNSVDPNSTFCPNCGATLQNKPGYLAGKDKITVALICFFFGGLGIHNFMMGETKKGIFRIVMNICLGLGCVFALIDFIKILTNSYVVDPNALV